MINHHPIPNHIPRRRLDFRKIIYVTLLLLFIITMFAAPFIYVVIRLNHGID